jgi:tetratricopeptide (TPR) repeat protein
MIDQRSAPLHATGDDEQQVDTLNAQAFACRHEDARRALALCQQACTMATRIGYPRGLAYARLRLALLEYMLGQAPEIYSEHLAQSLAAMRELSDVAGEAEALNLQGNIFATLGESARALRAHDKALALRRAIGDSDGEAASLNNIGVSLRDQMRLTDALEVLLQSHALARTSTSTGAPLRIAYAQLNIAHTLIALGSAAEAEPRLREVIEIAQTTQDRGVECSALTALGEALHRLKQHDAAAACLHSAMRLAEQTSNAGDQAQVQRVMAIAALAQGDWAAAQTQLSAALSITQRRLEDGVVIELQTLLGQCQWAQAQHHAALATWQQALATAHSHQLPSATLHQHLSQAHETLGDAAAALRHLREFHRLRSEAQAHSDAQRVRALLDADGSGAAG